MKPIIGISSNLQANFDGWFSAHYINHTKFEAISSIEKAGGLPVIIPVTDNKESIRTYLDMIDGLIITGGHDIMPTLYGENMESNSGNIYPLTDYYDMELIKEAFKRKMPLITICRGVQIANVTFGGNLMQDISKDINTNIKHQASQVGDCRIHRIRIEEDESLFSKLSGIKNEVFVNSIHHQAIDELADIFKVVARADDGIIEVIELKHNDDNHFFIGTQFHPEILGSNNEEDMLALFKGMIKYIKDDGNATK